MLTLFALSMPLFLPNYQIVLPFYVVLKFRLSTIFFQYHEHFSETQAHVHTILVLCTFRKFYKRSPSTTILSFCTMHACVDQIQNIFPFCDSYSMIIFFIAFNITHIVPSLLTSCASNAYHNSQPNINCLKLGLTFTLSIVAHISH